MSHRFFVAAPIASAELSLAGPEAHHLRDVMRAAAGDRIELFDGGGCEFVAEVIAVKRSGVTLRIVERREVDRELNTHITLGVALPKGERQRWLVEKGTELGVARLAPLLTERGVAEPGGGAIERLRRYVIEATKQCGRTRLMEIGPPVGLAAYLAAAPASAIRILAHPGGTPPRESKLARNTAGAAQGAAAVEVWLAIGPEGGFSPAEVAAAERAGWQMVDLGPRVLRVETAALLLAGLAAHAST